MQTAGIYEADHAFDSKSEKGKQRVAATAEERKRCCSERKDGSGKDQRRTGQYQTDAPDDVNVVCCHASGHGACLLIVLECNLRNTAVPVAGERTLSSERKIGDK